ncbi:MAG: NAD-dependent epimerase [marine bacterium B5-7]|nr:MAG: NAD-dependent epimerase [marine bacterium B5-7]
MHVLVTGAAGFIGSSLTLKLLEENHHVTGIDNLNDYYDVSLKLARLDRFKNHKNFHFEKFDISDREGMSALFERSSFDAVVNLAAQAGVRHSIENPQTYVDSNLCGFVNILEGCRHTKVGHLVYASSSSVYGSNARLPFSEHDNVDHPISLYAATKKANELIAHSYSHLYRIPTTGLRFFTVYGPWGRPDMALFRFARGILADQPIPVFNRGQMIRDFTYIDDIVEGIVTVLGSPATPCDNWSGESPDPATSNAPYRIYNIGNARPVELLRYIEVLEKELRKKAQLDLLPMQDGDVPATTADVSELKKHFDYTPSTSVEDGVSRFVEWYKSYYGE